MSSGPAADPFLLITGPDTMRTIRRATLLVLALAIGAAAPAAAFVWPQPKPAAAGETACLGGSAAAALPADSGPLRPRSGVAVANR